MASQIKSEPNTCNVLKKNGVDAFDVKCVKTEPGSGSNKFVVRREREFLNSRKDGRKFYGKRKADSSSNNGASDVKAKVPKKMSRSQKRKANSSFNNNAANQKVKVDKNTNEVQELESEWSFSDDPDEMIDGIHKCYALSIFNMLSYYEVFKTFKISENTSRQQNMQSGHEEAKISPYEVQMNDVYNHKIFEHMARDNLLKSLLPPNTLRSDPSIIEDPYILKGFLWEKDVNNPPIRVADGRIRQSTQSYLSNPNYCKRTLNRVITDLNNAVRFEGFTNRWNWYGSYLNGSACKDSTIDFYYEHVPEKQGTVTIGHRKLLKKLIESFEKSEAFTNVEFSAYVPFPWIRAYHSKASKKVKITFSNELHSGELRVQNSLLTKLYFGMNPDLKDLTVFLKIILQKYGIHGNGGGGRMNTYTLFWLVVFFMQQKKLLPAVMDVRKAAKVIHHVAGWDCSLPEKYSYPTEPISLYALVLGFFDFYRDFDFSRFLVCPYLGNVLLLSDFERLLIPTNEFSVYLRQIQNSRRLTFCRRVINLQDPSDLSFNTAERIQDEYANKFMVVCHRLGDLLPRFMEHIERMDCFCNLLPNKMNFCDYFPYNLTQYHTIVLHTSTDLGFDCHRQKKLNQIYILEAVRKIMEFVFKFERKKIVIAQNVSQVVFNSKDEDIVKRTFPVIYFEYCSSASTWQCGYMKEIIPRNADEKKPITVNLTCDVCLENELVELFVQSDVDFIKFLRLYLLKLFRYTLSEIVPP